MAECIFCKIVQKEIPAQIVYEDELVIAFKDLHAVAPTHILIIPKKHIQDTNSLQEEDLPVVGHIFKVIQQLVIEKDMAQEGYRIVHNCGALGGQTVNHIHFHLLGQREMGWPPG